MSATKLLLRNMKAMSKETAQSALDSLVALHAAEGNNMKRASLALRIRMLRRFVDTGKIASY